MNLRERNRQRTRRELAETSLRLFLSRGFDETTVEAIAREVGISGRTFFRYFPTKEAAFFANQEARLARFESLLGDVREGEHGLERVRRACLELAGDFMASRESALEQYRVIQSSRHLLAYDLQLDLKWEEAIFRSLAGDSEDAAVLGRARIRAGAFLGVIRAELRHWFAQGGSFDIVARGEEAFELLLAENLGEGL